MALFDRSSTLATTLDNSQRSKGCVPYDPNAIAPTYGYDPDLNAGILFNVVFFLSSQKWWYSAFALGAFAPCFFSAAIYYILGQMIMQYGRPNSLISARMYLAIFVSFDNVSIVIQAVGGASASKAGGEDPPGNPVLGTHIMMTGIIIQLVSMSAFGLLWLTFFWRARAVPVSRVLSMVTTFSAFCIIVRNFYRAIELSQGWKGYLIMHEVYLAVLDGALMAMSVGIFNMFFPARYLTGEPKVDSHDHEMGTTKGV